ILRADVEAAIARNGAVDGAPATAAAVPAAASEPQAESQAEPRGEEPLGEEQRREAPAPKEVSGVVDQRTGLAVLSRTPLAGLRKAAAEAMVRSRREIPDATVWVDVDATALVELRAGLQAKGSAPGLLAFVARFAAAGLARFPQLNSQLASDGGTDYIVEFGGINLGFATQTERGLVVPVLRNAQGRSARELDAAIRGLTGRALEGHAGPGELGGGTFTINNYGVLDGELCVRKMTELTLSFDHRVCDGAVAAGFLRFVADAMENPAEVLADL